MPRLRECGHHDVLRYLSWSRNGEDQAEGRAGNRLDMSASDELSPTPVALVPKNSFRWRYWRGTAHPILTLLGRAARPSAPLWLWEHRIFFRSPSRRSSRSLEGSRRSAVREGRRLVLERRAARCRAHQTEGRTVSFKMFDDINHRSIDQGAYFMMLTPISSGVVRHADLRPEDHVARNLFLSHVK